MALWLLALCATVTRAQCPNMCSGHGTCGAENVCACFEGFDYAPDCSLRTCPDGVAWTDKAFAVDQAHQVAECSNAGLCDRALGQCNCFTGYEGNACQRASCPNDCNANGLCLTISRLANLYGIEYDEYTNWDKDSVTACYCDPGFFGPDCSRRMCAKSDDPLTINQNYRSIHVELGAADNSNVSGTVEFGFLGYTTTMNAALQSSKTCEATWEKLDNVDDVDCIATGYELNQWGCVLCRVRLNCRTGPPRSLRTT